ncbi:hypothetical protein SAMN05216417_10687 [Nitrosospira multiformis]|uniref:Uncharacterized protein n=1 Tax=Nitrosospira multiformis TaxID=1231 RepID=A0A1I7GYC8_9PROT|nr:hypothetical protein SAMN05216417_10687 [Nitrosospira multiformis]
MEVEIVAAGLEYGFLEKDNKRVLMTSRKPTGFKDDMNSIATRRGYNYFPILQVESIQ